MAVRAVWPTIDVIAQGVLADEAAPETTHQATAGKLTDATADGNPDDQRTIGGAGFVLRPSARYRPLIEG